MKDAPRLALVMPPSEPESPFAARSDDELMMLTRAGVDGAFDFLVRRHQARVLRVAARYLGSTSAAADAAQNAFLEILDNVARYRAQGKFRSYLYRVVLNECRMARRSKWWQRDPLPSSYPIEDLSEDQILERERARAVEEKVHALSPKLRSVVLLRYGGDLSYDEIAEALEIPQGTVKRRLFDAMAWLRNELEGA
jgi:RNA polymerase sigma-70 factor (ECF subfamily)